MCLLLLPYQFDNRCVILIPLIFGVSQGGVVYLHGWLVRLGLDPLVLICGGLAVLYSRRP